MDFLSPLFGFLLWLFGVAEEAAVTRQQCAQIWEQGYVVYPLSDEQLERAQKCKELMADD